MFYQVREDDLPLYPDPGLRLSQLGEEAKVDLLTFSLEGSHRAELRQARNRARRRGAVFEVIVADAVAEVMGALKVVSDAWLEDKNVKEKGFPFGAFNEQYLCNLDVAVVRLDGAIVAFRNLWQSGGREELSVDLMRYSDKAPNGIMDYLFTELMLWGRDQGFAYFSLGMALLSGPDRHAFATLWHKRGNFIYWFGDHFYSFDALLRYKEKFAPQREARCLAAPGGLAISAVLINSTVLISGGGKEVFVK